MSPKSVLSRNPVHEVRTQAHLTLAQAAGEAGVHLQAFFLLEQGVYPDLLPAVELWLMRRELDLDRIRSEYHNYQTLKRVQSGEMYAFPYITTWPPSDENPFVEFRQQLPLSRMGFAKGFCVHPGSLYRVELGIAKTLPDQLVQALLEAGLSRSVLGELKYRIGEACRD